jgi:hypothetical protein
MASNVIERLEAAANLSTGKRIAAAIAGAALILGAPARR